MRRAGLRARAGRTCGGSRAAEQPRPCAARAMEHVPARTANERGTTAFREQVRPTASTAAEVGRNAGRTQHGIRRRATARSWRWLVSPVPSFRLGTRARRSDRHGARGAVRCDGRPPRARLSGAVRIGSCLSRAVSCDGVPAEPRGDVSCRRHRGSGSRPSGWPSCSSSVARRGYRGSRSSLDVGRYLLEAQRDLVLRACSFRQRHCRGRGRLVAEHRLTPRVACATRLPGRRRRVRTRGRRPWRAGLLEARRRRCGRRCRR
jgi:hypothetical protein